MVTRSTGLIHSLIHTWIFRWMCSHGSKKSFETICLYKHNYLQNYHNIYHYQSWFLKLIFLFGNVDKVSEKIVMKHNQVHFGFFVLRQAQKPFKKCIETYWLLKTNLFEKTFHVMRAKTKSTKTLVIKKVLKTLAFGSIAHLLWKNEFSHSAEPFDMHIATITSCTIPYV